MRSWIVCALLLTAVCACSSGPPPARPAVDRTFFFNGRILRGDGSPPIENAAFLVVDGLIMQMGADGSIESPAGAAEVDLGGRTVMPLLHSLHVHVGYLDGRAFSSENYSRESVLADLQRHAYHGVGSVVVLGSDADGTAFRIRAEQDEGTLTGYARVFTAGRGITTEGGWPTIIPALEEAPIQVTTPQGARDAVERLAANDVDLVKIWVDDNLGRIPKIAPDVYAAAIDEAHRFGLKAVAHVFYLDDARGLVDAGIDGLAHSIRDLDVDQELIDAMRRQDVFYVPTLVAHETAFSYAEAPSWVGEPAMRATVSAAVVEWISSEEFVSQAAQNPTLDELRQQYATAQRNLKALSDAGVTIGLGTDSGTTNRFPGYMEHRELELMVAAGMTPQQAIAAGTRNGALIMERGQVGTVGAGKRADFMVVEGDPLDDITTTRNIVEVSHGGRYLDRVNMAVRQPPQ